MHAAPSFQITVHRFGHWRAACGLLAASALAAWVAWAWRAAPVWPLWVIAGGFVLALTTASIARWCLRWRPFSLRWDTQRWFLGQASTRGQEPAPGRVAVSLDLGGWLLLRFEPEGAHPWKLGLDSTWLPLQRRGHELQWHALRSTVYCARPVSLLGAAPF